MLFGWSLSFETNQVKSSANLTSLDVRVVACQGSWVITSPNVDFVPEPHIFDKELCCQADGRFGLADCFQWPQSYHKDYAYAVCIPCEERFPFPNPLYIAWYMPTPADFVIPAGSSFQVGTLHESKVKAFEDLFRLMRSATHEIMRLQHHPLVFRDLVVFVAQLQRTLLDIYAVLQYVEILYPLLNTLPSHPVLTNPNWMGCFTNNTQVCKVLYFAGVPVWLVHREEFIPPTMNIVQPVRLTYPDRIVKAVYTENGVAKPFPAIYRGPCGALCHFHIHCPYEGNLTQEPQLTPSTASSSRTSSGSGRQSSQKQTKSTRERVTAGPSRASLQCSTSGQARWEEPDLPEIPKPHGLFVSAWKILDKNLQWTSSEHIDPGYHFPKPTLFVNVTSLEHKKTYLLNWLAARPLWISQVDVRPPSKFPSPQMWRDFLNTISMSIEQPSLTHSAASKSAVHNILGDDIVHLAQGMVGAPEAITWCGMEVQVASLSDPPLQFMRSLLWELYELNFRYELLALDRVLAAHLWISDESRITRQTLLYSIFPSESGLVMWSEPLLQGLQQLGMCASDMQVALPFLNNFCELLSTWPGAPAHLRTPAELDGQGNALV
ncbi:hypothetical protein EDD17DRAFT_1494768 [Pisolithus thermaeus]|nr:hypothetical protein EV401DRAFT_1877327 [Pisolithus croceorrhizus]KAI6146946.1 hypothetical protein EDD17DRAFT_1494768 [Pisolithus thermaeus]